MKYKGIVCSGNIILDEIFDIDRWPNISELSFINKIKYGPGGSAFNVSCNFKYHKAPFRIYMSGCIGDDFRGRKIIKICKKNNIEIDFLKIIKNRKTSFTNVIIAPKTKERTFFHYSGTNDIFNSNKIDSKLFDNKLINIFHVGYLCLLKGLEKKDKNNKLNIENLFIKLKKNNIEISADTITLEKHKYYKIFLNCIKYVDHLIINEDEALLLSNLNSKKSLKTIKTACIKIASYGVNKNIVIHSPKRVVWYDKKKFTIKNFKEIEKNKIINSSGSGDAFLAGILWGINLKYTKIKSINLAYKFAKKNLMKFESAPIRK